MQELKFGNALGALINMEIGLLLSDNQFIEGVLLDIKQDHIVVVVNKEIFYFARQHIQAISKNAKDLRISSEVVHYVDRANLLDVLKALRYNWVSINSLNDHVFFGVLSKISDDHITVINNSEILYIPNYFITTIKSNISEEQTTLNNTQELPVIKDCQIENKITSNYKQITKEIERGTNIKVTGLEMSPREGIEDEHVTYEQSESQQKTRVEMYATLLNLLKQNLLKKEIDNGRREAIFQETAICGFVSHIDEKSKGQSDSSVIELQDYQAEEQVIVEHTQTINEIEQIKSLENPIKEDSVGEGTEIENGMNENSEVTSQTVLSEVPNLSRLLKHDLLNKVSEYSIEELLPFTQSKGRHKKRRILLTAWNTINNDQYSIANHKNIAKENETFDCEGDPIKTEQPSDQIHVLIQPVHDQNLNEDFVTMEEKPKSVETTISQSSVIRISPKSKKEMLEKQYYALMKQAETNCFQMSERHLNLSEEEQYLALMKHAAKMYHEFKD